jgi:hypothetical protein
VKGRPDCAVNTALACQLRAIRQPEVRGPAHCAVNTNRWRTSKSEGPHSAARLRLSCGVLSSPSVARNADVLSIALPSV